jgi:broad specificity phosphatase PhoE
MTPIDGRRLLLIRHAMPEVDPSIPAEQWHLDASARAAARLLSPLVPRPAYFVASSEPKAQETLAEIAAGQAVLTDAGFAEVGRPRAWSDGETYRATARAYLQGTHQDGWERHDQVVNRFDEAVRHHAAALNQTLVIGTHGLALTIWLASRYSLAPSPSRFWEDLRLPDIVDVDLTTRTVSPVRL